MRSTKGLFTGVLLAIVLLLAISILPAAAQEPLTPGTSVEGTISNEDGESYTISATKGQLILISMESDELDSQVWLFDAAGTELAVNDDGGRDNDALLAYVAQDDGTFTVKAAAFWGGTGAFTLTPNVIDPPVVELNSSIVVTPGEDDLQAYAVFVAEADTVVNVRAKSQGDDGLSMTLMNLNAEIIETDTLDGPGGTPYVRRAVLPEGGFYLVAVESGWDETFTAPVEFFVETTERLFITETPYPISLSDVELRTEVFTFEAVVGTIYRITATIELSTGVEMDLLDTNAFFDPDFDSNNAVKVTWEWQSDVDGLVRLDVHPNLFSEGDNFTFMIETVQ